MPEREDGARALQMAVRVEKLTPPELDDAFIAAAKGVIALLDDYRCIPGGEWHDEVASWKSARIRKICRRARASAWQRAQGAAGRTVSYGTAEVRVFVPGIIDQAPPEVSKLQIQASPLPPMDPVDTLVPVAVSTVTIGLNPSVDMTWGKQAAQVGHAAQRCWESLSRHDRLDWNAGTRQVRVVAATPALWDERFASAPTQIRDGGFTEVAPGTLTAAAFLDRPLASRVTTVT